MSESKSNNSKRTEISEIGKINFIDNLFCDSGFKNGEVVQFHDPKSSAWSSVTKNLLEGIDFDLTYTPLKHLGYKAALSVFGEIYAKLYTPRSLSVTLALSKRFCCEDVQQLWEGFLAAAKEHKIAQLTLDLNASITGLSISLSAIGNRSIKSVKDSPIVEEHDLICISGNLGAAYMGLHVLEREKIAFNQNKSEEKQPDLSAYKYILSQYLSPEIKCEILNEFKSDKITPSSGYFITKGLASSIKQLCKESDRGAKIYISKIPISTHTFSMAEELNLDAITAMLNGGDDYKFLFTIPLAQHEKFIKEFPMYDVIGHICKKEAGEKLVTPDGLELDIKAQGW